MNPDPAADSGGAGGAQVLDAPVAGGDASLTGAQLAAALSQARARRAQGTAPGGTEPGEQPAPSEPAETPPAGEPGAPDPSPTGEDSSAASAAAEPEPGGEPEPVAEPEPPAEPQESKGIQEMRQRIDTLTARLRETERKLEEAQQGGGEPAKAGTPNQAANPGETNPEMRKISGELAGWRKVQEWCLKNADGGDITNAQTGEVTHSLTADQVQSLRAEADEMLADLRAQKVVLQRELRAEDQRLRAQNEQLLAQHFPTVKDGNSELAKFVAMVRERVPELEQRLPGWKLWTAAAFDWMQKAQAASKGKAPTKAATPPKIAVPSGGAAQRVDPLEKQLAAAEAALEKTGSVTDLKRVQSLKRQMRTRQT